MRDGGRMEVNGKRRSGQSILTAMNFFDFDLERANGLNRLEGES
jgi:hypothetical protein